MVRSILYYILLVVFMLLCFIPFAVLFLLTVLFDRERVVLHWASRMWSYGIFRLCPWWRIRIEGAEKIDRSVVLPYSTCDPEASSVSPVLFDIFVELLVEYL